MKVLSVKQPWVHLIFEEIKPIENRTWKCPEKYIGQRILIHASAKMAIEESNIHNTDPLDCLSIGQKLELGDKYYTGTGGLNRFEIYETSAIIGSVEIVDCVLNHESIWAQHIAIKQKEVAGEIFNIEVPVYNWVLSNPIRFYKPIENVKGKLSFWDYDIQICKTCGQPFGPSCVE